MSVSFVEVMVWQIRQLEGFRAVMEQGSITRAAAILHISQPAASKLVSELERACGFKVFHRQGNRLTATPEGQLLYHELERMFVSSHDIRLKVKEIREQRFGTMRISAFPALSTRIMPGVLNRFTQRHPEVRTLLTSSGSRFMIEWVVAQKSELGIGLLAKERPGISLVKMMQVEGVCVLPMGHELAQKNVIVAADFDGLPFISLTTQDKTQFLVEEFFRGRENKRRVVAEAQLSEAACQFVKEGAGLSIVDPFSVMGFRADELVVKKIAPPILFDVWLIFPTHRPTSLVLQSFVPFFNEELKALLSARGMRYVSFDFDIPH